MPGQHVVKEGLDAVHYSIEKCNSFLLAYTTEESLSALWHVSQLVHLLPNEIVKGIVHLAGRSPDFRIRLEVCYLAERWSFTEKKELLGVLETDQKAVVQEAFRRIKVPKKISPQKVEVAESIEELWSERGKCSANKLNQIKREARELSKQMGLMCIIKKMKWSRAVFFGSIFIALVLIGLLCMWIVSEGVLWLTRFFTAVAIGIGLYELVLILGEFWRNWERKK